MLIAWSQPEILIHPSWIEARCIKHILHKPENASADIHGKLGIPNRTGYDQPSKRKERRGRCRNLLVSTLLEIRVPKEPEEHLEGALETTPAAQGKKQIVNGHRSHIVGRLTPLTPGSIQDGKICSSSKEHIPWMKVSMHLRQSVRLIA